MIYIASRVLWVGHVCSELINVVEELNTEFQLIIDDLKV